MVYVVIPFRAGSAIQQRLEALTHQGLYTSVAPSAYFISYLGTTKELAETIGYNGDEGAGTGIVIPVSNYFGYAPKDLWEWLELHGKD